MLSHHDVRLGFGKNPITASFFEIPALEDRSAPLLRSDRGLVLSFKVWIFPIWDFANFCIHILLYHQRQTFWLSHISRFLNLPVLFLPSESLFFILILCDNVQVKAKLQIGILEMLKPTNRVCDCHQPDSLAFQFSFVLDGHFPFTIHLQVLTSVFLVLAVGCWLHAPLLNCLREKVMNLCGGVLPGRIEVLVALDVYIDVFRCADAHQIPPCSLPLWQLHFCHLQEKLYISDVFPFLVI